MRHAPFWPMLEAIAPTLAYDHTALLSEDGAIPIERTARVNVPTLALHGGFILALWPRTALAKDAKVPFGPPKTGGFSIGLAVADKAEGGKASPPPTLRSATTCGQA